MDEKTPINTLNCPINNLKISNLEKTMSELVEAVKISKEQDFRQEEMLAKFDTIIEFLMYDRKKQETVNEKTIEVLSGMNQNLTELNGDVKHVIVEHNSIKEQMDIMKISQLAVSEKNKVDLGEIAKNSIVKVTEFLMYSGIIYILYQVITSIK